VSVRVAVGIALALNGAAALVSIDRGMPADWAGLLNGDPDNVLADWLGWRGTAIAPPLAVMLALAVLAFASHRSRAAMWALAAVAAGGVVGYLGEPATWEVGWATTPFAWGGIVLYAFVAGRIFVALSHKVDSAADRAAVGAA